MTQSFLKEIKDINKSQTEILEVKNTATEFKDSLGRLSNRYSGQEKASRLGEINRNDPT